MPNGRWKHYMPVRRPCAGVLEDSEEAQGLGDGIVRVRAPLRELPENQGAVPLPSRAGWHGNIRVGALHAGDPAGGGGSPGRITAFICPGRRGK